MCRAAADHAAYVSIENPVKRLAMIPDPIHKGCHFLAIAILGIEAAHAVDKLACPLFVKLPSFGNVACAQQLHDLLGTSNHCRSIIGGSRLGQRSRRRDRGGAGDKSAAR
jgi:hypothetical protein